MFYGDLANLLQTFMIGSWIIIFARIKRLNYI